MNRKLCSSGASVTPVFPIEVGGFFSSANLISKRCSRIVKKKKSSIFAKYSPGHCLGPEKNHEVVIRI